MIILSGVLIVVAIALLAAGTVPSIISGDGGTAEVLGVEAQMVIYLSIAVSLVSALCLIIGVFVRRKELFPGSAPAAGDRRAKGRKAKKRPARPTAAQGRGKSAPAQDGATGDTVVIPSPPAEVPGDAVVFVVRGRKRYHLDTCRQLAGRDREELTYAEAKEEGFSPCTACMPDTALAARAAVSVAAGPVKEAAGETSATAPLPKPSKPGDRPVGPPPSASGTGRSEPVKAAAAPATEPPRDQPAKTSPPKTRPESTPGAPTARPSLEDPPPAGFGSDPLDTGAPFGSGGRLSGSGRPAADAPAPATAATPSGAPAAGDAAGDDVPVKILSGTRRYHRPGCALLEDIGDGADDLESLTRGEAKARDCTPCLVCRPDDPS
ncbi:hypothetical protein Acsp03_11120 [Actinomadura sp. NBRC 104412]|uniref:hypothetical protein n=1 Tax=Actinomadura sp. NBRC 104412 TaxID=3032203 RepID=UPI0024A46E52|nr:hypothetical protein [Actinomadura sp. NBRC 104412]GLZ03645.1 hypothetical protein Acsp03_11120 [Actinomadura sp. NBRC 104412]